MKYKHMGEVPKEKVLAEFAYHLYTVHGLPFELFEAERKRRAEHGFFAYMGLLATAYKHYSKKHKIPVTDGSDPRRKWEKFESSKTSGEMDVINKRLVEDAKKYKNYKNIIGQ